MLCMLANRLESKDPDPAPDYRMVEEVATKKAPTNRARAWWGLRGTNGRVKGRDSASR